MHTVKTYLAAFMLLCWLGCKEKDGYQSVTLSPRQLSNLHAFAKLYGYARYFYPGTETNKLEWDNFVLYGAVKVIDAPNDTALKDTLQKLLQPLMPTLRINDNGVVPALDTAALIPKDTSKYQVSYWQHRGLTNGNHSVAFRYQRSQLMNQYNKVYHRNTIEEFGVICNIPIKAYRGSMLKFSVDVKCDPGNGKGESVLFLQPSNINGYYGSSSRSEPEKGDNKWHRRELLMYVPAFADSILLGTFLRTEGTLQIDNCRVQVEKNNKWIDIPVPNSNFERDSIGKTAATWKVWPDYYPGTIVVESNEFAQGKQVLQINAVTIRQKSHFISEPFFDLHPSFGTAVQGKLGSSLAFSFPLAMYASGGQTYPAADSVAVSQLVRAVAAIQASDKKVITRLADMIILWNVLQHGYISPDDSPGWEKQLDGYLTMAASTRSFDEYYAGMQKILADTKDGFMEMLPSQNPVALRILPVTIGWASGHLVIIGVDDPKDADGLEVCDEVIQVNNKDALAYFTSKDSLLSHSNFSQLLSKRLYDIQLGTLGQGIKLTVKKKNDQVHTAILPYSKNYGSRRIFAAADARGPFKQVKPGVLLVSLTNVNAQQIDSLVHHLSPGIQCIIWDCRQAFSTLNFLHYLMPVNDSLDYYYQVDLVYPDKDKRNLSSATRYVFPPLGKPLQERLHVKSLFLSEHSDKAYSEGVLNYVRSYHLGEIIGEPTYGFGNPFSTLILPGGMVIYINGLFAKDDDGKLHADKGLKPDVEVWPTLQGIREGRDEILERAIQYAGTK